MGVEDKQEGSRVVSESIVEKRLDYDSESQSGAAPQNGTLKRQLKNRHIAMIRYVFSSTSALEIPAYSRRALVSVVCSSRVPGLR